MSITQNKNRVGNFTSSNIYKLLTKNTKGDGFGAPALKYISQKQMERRQKRSIDVDVSSKPTAWGKFMEDRVHDLIGLEYKLQSNETFVHPKYPFWAGSPDFTVSNGKYKRVVDLKCYYPDNFGFYTDVLLQGDTEVFKKEFPKEYWQLVSNAAILGYKYAEAISYMPYESELEDIREMAENYTGERPWEYRFIYEDPKEYLPYLPDDSYYKNLNKFIFKIPTEDKKELTSAIKAAYKLLNK